MKRVLVVRNDKLGDFILVWPALALLKQISGAHISVLVPAYTAPMACLCPSIDNVIIDPSSHADRGEQRKLLEHIKALQFDCAIAVFSNGRNARLLWQAKIPHRFAPATKWAQVLYNHRLRQRRSQSAKPEWLYNVDLIQYALQQQGFDVPVCEVDATLQPPYLRFEQHALTDMRHQVATKLGLNVDHRWLIVHPGTGGSAGILATSQYVQFLNAFVHHEQSKPVVDPRSEPFAILVTAGPNETELAVSLVQALSSCHMRAAVLTSQEGLVAFSQVIANSALFLAAGTGPLHIAGALDVPTVGVFPARRSNTALRWQPLNQPMRHRPISVPNDALDPEDLSVIDWSAAGVKAREWFDQLKF